MRVVSAILAAVILGAFLLPSTVAIYGVFSGSAWDLQDLSSIPSPLPASAISALVFVLAPVRLAIAFQAGVTHPIAQVPLFELDCALIR